MPADEGELQTVLDKISAFTNLVIPIEIVAVENTDNAEACPSDGGKNYVAFKTEWLQGLYDETHDEWVIYAVLAHEIGHFALGHEKVAYKPELEAQADEYAGRLLAMMGASLENTLSVFRSKHMQGIAGGKYPTTDKRIAAAKIGWESEQKSNSSSVNSKTQVEKQSGSNNSEFVIETPLKGETVGLTTMVRGKTPYSQLNHYVVVISFTAQRYFIQQPVRMLSNGNWEGFAIFGEENYGRGHKWSIRILATRVSLPVGEIKDFPKDAILSNDIIVTRNRE